MTFLSQQIPSYGVWEVGKRKISCKEAGSVQYKAHRTWAPPHAPQQIRCVVDRMPQTVIWTEMQKYAINWRMVRNKHHSNEWH